MFFTLENCKAVVQPVPNLLWPFWGQPVHGPGPHVTDATRNFNRFYIKADTIKLYWNRPDLALDDHVWKQHVVVLSPSGGLWMRQHERGGCLWCEPYNCWHSISIALYHPGSSEGLLALCLCLSVCFCVLPITTLNCHWIILLIRNYELVIRNYELVIRNYELVIRNYELLIRNYEFVIRNYEFRNPPH